MSSHQCNPRCVCPIHRTPMRYWPAGDDHTCLVDGCPNAQGFRSAEVEPLEVTVTADTGRLVDALHRASTAMCGAGLAFFASRTLAEVADWDAEQNRTRQLGRDIGLTARDTDTIVTQVLRKAGQLRERQGRPMPTAEVYREVRRCLIAHANGLRFLPFQQGIEVFLAKPDDQDDGKGRPKCL